MVMLRLLGIFGFIVLLAGCNVSDDVKALNDKIKMVKDDIEMIRNDVKIAFVGIGHLLQPCKPPGEHSTTTCYYKLEILKSMGNKQYQGRVPDSVILEQNNECMKNNSDPKQCVSYGDTRAYTFTINGSTPYEPGNVVECTSDSKDNLNCTPTQAMKKT